MYYNTFDDFFRRYCSWSNFVKDISNTYNNEPEDVYVKNEADDFVGEEEKNKGCYDGWAGEIEIRRFVTCEEDITLPFKSPDSNRDINIIINDINIMRRYMFEITKNELSSYRAKNSEHIKFLLMSNFDKIKVFDPIIYDDGSGDTMHPQSFLNVYMSFAFEYFIEYDIEESQFKFRSKKFKGWKELKDLISKSKFIPLCIH